MEFRKAIWISVGLLGLITGGICAGISIYYVFRYYSEPPGPVHSELLGSVILGYTWATCAFVLAAVAALLGRKHISDRWFKAMIVPGSVFAVSYICIVLYALL